MREPSGDSPTPFGASSGKITSRDRRAVGLRVEDAGAVARALLAQAVVGEVEAAVAVEHEVVGRAQRAPVAFLVEHLDLARAEVDALDAAAAVVARRLARHRQPVHLEVVERGPVVAHVELAVRPDRGAVRPAAGLGDDLRRAVRADARDRAARRSRPRSRCRRSSPPGPPGTQPCSPARRHASPLAPPNGELLAGQPCGPASVCTSPGAPPVAAVRAGTAFRHGGSQPASVTSTGPSLVSAIVASQPTRARRGSIVNADTFVASTTRRFATGAGGAGPQVCVTGTCTEGVASTPPGELPLPVDGVRRRGIADARSPPSARPRSPRPPFAAASRRRTRRDPVRMPGGRARVREVHRRVVGVGHVRAGRGRPAPLRGSRRPAGTGR